MTPKPACCARAGQNPFPIPRPRPCAIPFAKSRRPWATPTGSEPPTHERRERAIKTARSLNQRGLWRDVMADDAPLTVFARDDPAYLDRQRGALSSGKNDAVPAKLIKSGLTCAVAGIAELNGRRTPSRQRIEIGRNTLLPTIERWVRSEEECVFRVEGSKRFGIEPAKAGRPFLDDGGYYFVGSRFALDDPLNRKTTSLALNLTPSADFLGKRVAQTDGAVEHRTIRRRVLDRARNSPAARTAPAQVNWLPRSRARPARRPESPATAG